MGGNDPYDTFRPQQSAREAEAQVERWIPNGITLADAVNTLGRHGFSCQPATPAGPETHAAMLCQFKLQPLPAPEQRLTAPGTPVSWFITLNSSDSTTLSRAQVARLPEDIGG
jgi:hypothetical protein